MSKWLHFKGKLFPFRQKSSAYCSENFQFTAHFSPGIKEKINTLARQVINFSQRFSRLLLMAGSQSLQSQAWPGGEPPSLGLHVTGRSGWPHRLSCHCNRQRHSAFFFSLARGSLCTTTTSQLLLGTTVCLASSYPRAPSARDLRIHHHLH